VSAASAALVLFDIDGTLLSSQGAGRRAMEDAGRDLYGEGWSAESVEVNGRLDPLIWADMARANAVEPTEARHAAFRARYRERLKLRLRTPGVVEALPGVETLLLRLQAHAGVTIGILSGNYPETGAIKLRAGGLAPEQFTVCAWGDDAATRPDLVPVARTRYRTVSAEPLPSDRVWIIGDTPHDVGCARAHGCRSIAVATGRSSVSALLESGAERAVPTLADVDQITAWISERRA